MSQPFVGEITMFGGNFAIANWAMCNGQILSISQNTALFSLLGTTYGGNGTNSFGLPNFEAATPMFNGQGPGLSSYVLGQTAGAATVTLSSTQIPMHTHSVSVSAAGQASDQTGIPSNSVVLGDCSPGKAYSTVTTPQVAFSPLAVSIDGGSLPHANQQPYLALTFLIALFGVFPNRN